MSKWLEFTKSNFLKNKKWYLELHFGILVGVMLTWCHCNSASIQVKQVHIVDIQHSNKSCYKSCPCMSTNRHFSAIWVIHACPFFYSNNICPRQPATHTTSRSSVIPTKSSSISTKLDPFILDKPANYRNLVTLNVVQTLVARRSPGSFNSSAFFETPRNRHVDGRPCQAAPLGCFQALQHLWLK